jgi:hypothetical protein
MSDQCVQTVVENISSSDLDREMRNAENVVNCLVVVGVWVEKLAKILQNGVTHLLMALLTLDNPEQLSFSVGVECPRVVI